MCVCCCCCCCSLSLCVYLSHPSVFLHAQCHLEACYLKKMDVRECVALWLGYRDMTVCLSSKPVYCCLCIMMLHKWMFSHCFQQLKLCFMCCLTVPHSHVVFSHFFPWVCSRLGSELNVRFRLATNVNLHSAICVSVGTNSQILTPTLFILNIGILNNVSPDDFATF